jgi:ubiquinone/menaquinone biosynthesis C-methylase UbiE
MPDLFDNFDQKPPEMREAIIAALEQGNAAPERRAILESYLAEMALPPDARMLEVGCGSGGVTRVLARWPGVREAVGIDPWASFIDKAREFGTGIDNLSFQQADGHALPFADASFDAVVFHTTLLHMADPATALAEAHRVLRPGGWLSVFDPDPLATTYAVMEHDPVQTVYEAGMMLGYLSPWLPRQLPSLIRAAGFAVSRARSFGVVDTEGGDGVLSFFDANVDLVAGTGAIGPELAAALKGEARRRVAQGTFVRFGSSVSIIARRGD